MLECWEERDDSNDSDVGVDTGAASSASVCLACLLECSDLSLSAIWQDSVSSLCVFARV